jgi:hypothetical protein
MLSAARLQHDSGLIQGMRRARALLGLIAGCVVALLVHASPARAEEVASGPRNRVVLLGAKNPTDAAAWWSSASAQLSDLDVERIEAEAGAATLEDSARMARVEAERHGALAVVWLESDAGVVTVFLLEAKRGRLRARRVLVSGTAEAAAEEVGVVIRSAISALLEGIEVSMPEIAVPHEPTPPAPEQPAPPPAPPASRPEHLRLLAGYLGTLYSLDAAWQNGVAASAALRLFDSPWFFELGYAFLPPLELSAPGVKSSLRRHPVEAGVGLELGIGRFRVATEALFIADFVSRRTTRADEPLARAPSESRTLFAGSLRLRGALPLGSGFAFYAAFGAEFLLNRFDHVVRGSESPEPSITQLAARPRVDAGLSYAFF